MIEIKEKDLYQFLICECRYGYTRNNGLMPSGAYEHVKTYLPLLKDVDKDYAIHTAQQLCDECISIQINTNFYDGYDDELGNRKEAFDFIEYLLSFIDEEEKGWCPYNYEDYLNNKAKDYEPRYTIYEASYESLSNEDEIKEENFPENVSFLKLINTTKISKHDLTSYLFKAVLGLKEGEPITYRRWYTDMFGTKTTKYVFDDLKRVFYVTALDLDNQK